MALRARCPNGEERPFVHPAGMSGVPAGEGPLSAADRPQLCLGKLEIFFWHLKRSTRYIRLMWQTGGTDDRWTGPYPAGVLDLRCRRAGRSGAN